MKCPACQSDRTRVVDSRPTGANAEEIRRRRVCEGCGQRFTTYERVEWSYPQVIKRSGERVDFEERKLREGFRLALHKRPVPAAQQQAAIDRVLAELRKYNQAEIASHRIGTLVLNALFDLDQVAYIRFASIYLLFNDLKSFREAIERAEGEAQARARSKLQIPLLSLDDSAASPDHQP
ncbi:MAG: transcriptional regulator NrdR [Thioalkalivibrionaceae bacterium]